LLTLLKLDVIPANQDTSPTIWGEKYSRIKCFLQTAFTKGRFLIVQHNNNETGEVDDAKHRAR
jgi:hypothetical protein